MSRFDLGDSIMNPATVPATVEGFWQRVDLRKTGDICATLADLYEQLLRGELHKDEYKTRKAQIKRNSAFYTPHAHFLKGYKSSDGQPEDSGMAVVDLDGCNGFVQLYRQRLKGREKELGIDMVNRSVSGTGGHVLFEIPEGMTRQEAQAWMADEVLGGVSYDQAVHEPERAIFLPCREYILYIDEELMFGDTRKGAVIEHHPSSIEHHPSAPEHHPSSIIHQPSSIEHQPSPRALAVFDETLQMTELDLPTINQEGVRHNTLKLLLPTLCQMMAQEELLAVLGVRMPEYSKEKDCRELVSNFYDKYVDQNRPMNLKQKEVFLRSLRVLDTTGPDSPAPDPTPRLVLTLAMLPIGLRESLKPYPENMWPPLVVGQMPAMMALADGVSYRYCDGKTGYLGAMAIIQGEQASNKSAIEEAVERWLVDLRREDAVVKEREDRVREANKRRKASERAQEDPGGVVRVVPITISCSKLLKRFKQSQGHCLYSICTEAETLIKTNGSGTWAQKWDIYRNAFGREMWGTDYNSDQSESGDVRVAYNWTLLGTPRTIARMFQGRNESNVENGLSSRMMLSKMPDSLFAPITVFRELSQDDTQRICQAAAMLRSASGFYDTPRLRKAIDNWLETTRRDAAMNMDIVKDRFRRRAGLIGFRCGVVFMLLAGKETKACVNFAVSMAEYTLQMQLAVFGPWLARLNSGDAAVNKVPTVNGSVFEQLPQTFGILELRQAKGREFSDGTLYSIISRWKSDGWIEKVGKNWKKVNIEH